jgi:hypothetical protein
MTVVSAEDLKRRDKLLGMLTSDFDGERATAAAMLAKLASQYKMTLPEFCAVGATPQPSSSGGKSSQKSQAKPQPQSAYQPDDPNSMEMLMMLRRVIDYHLDLVTEWEEEFLENVTNRYFRDVDLSEKQRTIAMRILTKVAMTSGRPRDGFRPV